MKYTTYNDKTSTESNIQLGSETVSISIEMVNGEIKITGKTESGTVIDYTNKIIQTVLDEKTSSGTDTNGLKYVSDFANNGITATEMKYIMAELIGGTLGPDAGDLYAAGSIGYDWESYVSTTKAHTASTGDKVSYSVVTIPPGNGYSYTRYQGTYTFSGPSFPDDVTYSYTSSSSSTAKDYAGNQVLSSVWGLCFTAEEVYSVDSTYYESLYGNNMVVYGSSTSSNRVIGVEFTTTENGQITNESQEPDGFDSSVWEADPSEVFNVSVDEFLGASSVAEPYYRTELRIPDPFLEGSAIASMSKAELSNYLITVSQLQVDDTVFNDNDELVEKHFLTVYEPVPPDIASYFEEENITFIIVDRNTEEDYQAVDRLCEAIAADSDLEINYNFTDRKPTSLDDLHIDDNYSSDGTNRFVIEVGQYSQEKVYYTKEEILGDVLEYREEPIIEEVISYDYIYEYDGDPIILQVGDQNKDFDRIYVYIDSFVPDVEDLYTISIAKQQEAADAVAVINDVINSVSLKRSDLGAYENRLDHTINVNRITTENLTAAESRIRDTDFAEEMMKYTANNIMIQAAQSMLAHANQNPEIVLSLLQ